MTGKFEGTIRKVIPANDPLPVVTVIDIDAGGSVRLPFTFDGAEPGKRYTFEVSAAPVE